MLLLKEKDEIDFVLDKFISTSTVCWHQYYIKLHILLLSPPSPSAVLCKWTYHYQIALLRQRANIYWPCRPHTMGDQKYCKHHLVDIITM